MWTRTPGVAWAVGVLGLVNLTVGIRLPLAMDGRRRVTFLANGGKKPVQTRNPFKQAHVLTSIPPGMSKYTLLLTQT